MVRKLAFVLCLTGVLLALPVASALADSKGEKPIEMVKVWEVDFSGRPPFKRRLIELPAAEVAALAAARQIIETKRVWTVDYSGRPPFKRRYENVPVIDATNFETGRADASDGNKRPKSRFKRHR